jgi:long-chain acyl-CoA synthetase
MRNVIIALAALVATSGAFAIEVAGVKVDDKASVGGQELVLNGAGVRTRAIFKVYVGSLYVPAKATDLGKCWPRDRGGQMNILRNLTPDQLVDALVDGLKRQFGGRTEHREDANRGLVTIMKSFGDVKEKDVVTLDFVGSATRIGYRFWPKDRSPRAFNHYADEGLAGRPPGQPD